MYSWKFLKENYQDFGNAKIKLMRKPTMQKIYDLHLKEVDEKYVSRGDYIRIFSLKWMPILVDNKIKAVKNNKSLNIYLELNLFPYNLRKGINHYIVWFDKPISDKEMREFLDKNLKGEYIYYSNDKINKSINDLEHIHVFNKV